MPANKFLLANNKYVNYWKLSYPYLKNLTFICLSLNTL